MHETKTVSKDPSAALPRGFKAFGIFLFCAAVPAGLSSFTFLRPGTRLDRIWTLNPDAYEQLMPFRNIVGTVFLVLAVALFVAGVGWFLRKRWGWELAVTIVALQVGGDAMSCMRGNWLSGGFGLIIAGWLLLVLLRPKFREVFADATD